MAEEQPTVTVTLAVSMSEGEFGYTGKAGDQIEVPVDVANAWIDAGIAEPVGKAARTSTPAAEKPPAEEPPTEEPPPRVPRRGNAS